MSRAKNTVPDQPVYIDRPEISEVFADRVQQLSFDGGTLRIELAVVRQAEGDKAAEPRQWAYTAARLVLSVQCANDLQAKLRRLEEALQLQRKVAGPASGTA